MESAAMDERRYGHRVVITSANYPHYIGFDGNGDWLWVKNFNDAHRFESEEEAQQFVQRTMPDMNVWYLKRLW
jgi:hypothetical protein